jgi:integrase
MLPWPIAKRRCYGGKFSTRKGTRTRRVDMSRELREVLLGMRGDRLLKAWQSGRSSISDELVFPGKDGTRPISVRTPGRKLLSHGAGASKSQALPFSMTCATPSARC